MTRAGVIGLGTMGGAMARHLVVADFVTFGYDVDEDARRRAQEQGVSVISSVAQISAESPTLLLSLPAIEAARSVVDEIAAAGHSNLVIETSTFSLAEKLELADRLERGGIRMLDCPISGTGAQMAEGDVVVYASGAPEAIAEVRPQLQAFARQVIDLGPVGNGTAMKLVANCLVAIHNVATAEALLLGKKAGIAPDLLIEAIRAGAGNSRIFELRGPMVAADRYEPATMKLDVWAKDMAAVSEFAKSVGASTPLLDTTAPLYSRALAAGLGALDTAAVARVLDRTEEKKS